MKALRPTPVQSALAPRSIAAHLALLAALAVPLPAAAEAGESRYSIEGKVTVEVVRAEPTPASTTPPPARLTPAAPLRFDLDRAEPVPDSLPALEELAATLRSNPGVLLRIEAHTDDLGSESRNQSLSRQRAAWVLRWLAGHGVAPDRLSSVGFGASRPVAPNDSEAGRQLNRRVDFVLVASR